MSKFQTIQLAVGSLMNATGLELYPEEYKGDIVTEGLFGRYSVSFNDQERSDYGDGSMIRGMITVRIFFERGGSSYPATQFADTLSATFDMHKENFSVDYSTLAQPTEDPDNEALSMAIWQASFTKYI